ncbi:MAG TPA: hypothetical protein VHC98_03640 [Candidatus Saccharimonadales bacterium]|nr:hypothetical protein [Candidatus Saccharimonadales bacterium]
MKQKDLAMIVLIAGISGGIALVASHFIFSAPSNSQQKAAVVPVISTRFTTPDPQFFNTQSFDPAKLIEVGSNNNTNPFDGSGSGQ